MANSTDKQKPEAQDIKRQKILEQVQEITGIKFEGDAAQNFPFAQIIHDAVRVGARKIDPDFEDSPIHCCAEWHFARFSGPGLTLVNALYGISWHLAGESGTFFPSMTKLAPFLNKTKADELYAAADLLVTSGFWETVEALNGKPVKYRPIAHAEWAEKHPGLCTAKIELNFPHDDPELAILGKKLYAIFGGEKFYPNVLRGIRSAADGLNDEEICEHAKQFMADDAVAALELGVGKERRKRFIQYLRGLDDSE